MPGPTLIPTYGSMTANTYVAFAVADAFITTETLDSQPWADASSDQRTIALIQATRTIDAYNWHGERYFYRQALAFPRVPTGIGIFDSIGPYGPGVGQVGSVL